MVLHTRARNGDVTSSRVTHVRHARRMWHLQWMAARFLKLSSESVASLELIGRDAQIEFAFSKSGMQKHIPTLNEGVMT